MECVRCIERRETMPNQLEEGKLYWLDEDSKYIDPDGDTYATIYRDAEATKEIGVLHIKHFRTDYKQIMKVMIYESNDLLFVYETE